MGMARPPMWDKDGVSINSYTTEGYEFRDFTGFISYMTKKEDPSGEFFYEIVDEVITENIKKNKGNVSYRWTDEKHVKNKHFKSLIAKAKTRAKKEWDWNDNSRIIMFIINVKDGDFYLRSYISDITNKNEYMYKLTYGGSNIEA
jgi:hypothetical protein